MRFGAVPIPLFAVQRYVPLLFLLVSRTNWFPVASTSLSPPLAYTLVQVIIGVGSPSAIHSKVILGSPSTTTASLLTLLNSGGSVKELKTKSNFAHYPRYTPIWHLGHLQQQLHIYWLNWILVDLFRSDSSDRLSHSQNLQNWTNLPQNLATKIKVKNPEMSEQLPL